MYFSAPNPGSTVALILAGGGGGCLGGLTDRCLLPLGTDARLVDCTLNNCLHSGIQQVGIVAQGFQHELEGVMHKRWTPCPGMEVTTLPALDGSAERGSAAAVRQTLTWLVRQRARRVLILAGDLVYRFDYQKLLDHHERQGCAVSTLCLPEDQSGSLDHGVVEVDDQLQVRELARGYRFSRQPSGAMARNLAVTGVYLADVCVLAMLLLRTDERSAHPQGFGFRVIPAALQRRLAVSAYLLPEDSQWRDVSSAEGYYAALQELRSGALDSLFAGWELPSCYDAREQPAGIHVARRLESGGN